MTDPGEITRLLHRWKEGNDPDAESQLFKAMLPQLRKIAARCLRGERRNHTLQQSDLVNEGFIRLRDTKDIAWLNEGHFLAMATRKMRFVLIEYARRRGKRIRLPLEGIPETLLTQRNWLEIGLIMEELMNELEKEFPAKCSVIVCRSYMGMSTKETAKALNITEATVEHEWFRARQWLFKKLSEGPNNTGTKD